LQIILSSVLFHRTTHSGINHNTHYVVGPRRNLKNISLSCSLVVQIFFILLQVKIYLVVLAIGFALGVEDTGPVLGLEVGLGVDIDLNLNVGSLLLDGVGVDTDGVEETAEELADAGGAPRADDLTSLQGELGAEDGVLDGGAIDLAEGKGLVDGGALVAEGEDGARGVDGNADGKAAGDTGGGGARAGELLNRDAGDVLKLGGELSGLKSSVGPGVGGLRGKSSSAGDKGGGDGGLHFV